MSGIRAVAQWKMTVLTFALAALLLPRPLRGADFGNAQWSVTLVGFFPGEATKGGGGPKRLNCYLVRRDGKWVSALATATNQGRPIWNTAMMLVDPSGASVKDDKLTGTLAVTLVPDPWVPKDQKSRLATVTLDATVTPDVIPKIHHLLSPLPQITSPCPRTAAKFPVIS